MAIDKKQNFNLQPITRTEKPSNNIGIDWSNPLSKRLKGLVVGFGHVQYELVKKSRPMPPEIKI